METARTIQLIAGLLALCGAAFLTAAIVRGRRTAADIPRELSRRWRLMTGLMVFFLAGYLFFVAIIVRGVHMAEEIVTGTVFFGGAIFVYVVIDLTGRAIRRIRAAEDDLRGLNESLERRVTERTQALRRSHSFLKTVLDSLNDAVCIIDAKDMRILGANAAFLRDHNLREQDVIGRTCHEVTHDRHDICSPPDDQCPLLETLRTGGHAVAEHVHVAGGGGTVHVEIAVHPIRDPDGTIIQAVHVSRDITARREAERKLHHSAEELQRSNEDLKNFLYIASHDLRVPLVNIKGFAGELDRALADISGAIARGMATLGEDERDRVDAVVRKDIPEAIEFIQSSVSRIDGLLTAVLKLSRLGRRELAPERIDVDALVRHILSSQTHQLERKNVAVTIGALPEVTADPMAMDQIMGNLLDNAVKYLEPGRPGVIEVFGEATPMETVYHVRDNGRGLSREDIPRAFEIFRRIGKQDVPGEGMGLAYVKSLVLRQGGRISCESEPGKGSTFSFTVPRTR